MSTMYPLAIINIPSSTSLVRMTLYRHVYHAKIETTEGVAASGGTPRSATMENPLPQIVSDILGERSVKHGQSRPPAGRDVIHQNPV